MLLKFSLYNKNFGSKQLQNFSGFVTFSDPCLWVSACVCLFLCVCMGGGLASTQVMLAGGAATSVSSPQRLYFNIIER